MLGLELQEHRACAVAVDEHGSVLGRGSASGATLADAALFALNAAAAGAGAGASGAAVGVCAASPDAEENPPVIKHLSPRYPMPHGADVFAAGTAAAIAETWCGAAKGANDVAFFAVGDHVMAGVVRDGAPAGGTRRRPVALGWLALNPVEREDYRKIGCLEAEVAAAGIVRRLVWRIKAGDRSRVQDAAGGDLSAITAAQILDAARAGDGVSISVVRDTAKYLGMAAANLAVIFDPQVLVLGGIMASAADLLLEPVRVELSRRVPPGMMQALTIVPATLGGDAAAIGAARLAAAVQ